MPSTFTADGSVILGPSALNSMPADLRSAVFKHAFPGLAEVPPAHPVPLTLTSPPSSTDGADEDQEGGLADFSEPEFLELLAGCSEKTRQLLGVLARGDQRFNLDAVAKALGVEPGKLGGMWSGLTRRTRKLKKSSDIIFVAWEWDAKTECYWGLLSEITHASLKKTLSA